MITWGELREIVFWNLQQVGIDYSDYDTGVVDPDALTMYGHAVTWSLDIFAIDHTALEMSHAVTIASGGVVEMPDNTLFIRGVFSVDNELWLRPYTARVESGNTGKGWYEWPARYIHTIGTSGELEVAYYAYHPEIDEDDQAPIRVPRWAVPAIVDLICAKLLSPQSVSSANLAQYKIRIESGDPEDNPLLLQVKHFLGQYEWLTSKVERQRREVFLPK